MATSLVWLEGSNVLVEIQDVGGAQQISGGVADRVAAGLDQIQGVLRQVSDAIGVYWKQVGPEVSVEKIEAEFGVSFEGEGNIFITKAKAGANLVVKLSLVKPPQSAEPVRP